jgi:hypothetical protein
MAHRTYAGLGSHDAAIREFERLAPYVSEMLAMRAECVEFGPDHAAMGVPIEGIRTSAYHFTRRRDFYHELEARQRESAKGTNGRLGERSEAVAAFRALEPYNTALRLLQGRCRPFGRDYLALEIAKEGLETAAYHFTGEAAFYGARGDSAGPIRPRS